MDTHTLALLFSLLQVFNVCAAAPLPREVEDLKYRVKIMADNLIARLDSDFEFPSSLTPVDDLDGASSIVTVLEGYNNMISENYLGVTQVKAEISSLTAYVSQWRQDHCGEQRQSPSMPRRLQEMQRMREFTHVVSMEALIRVRDFLHLLRESLDQLETC